MGLNYLKPDEKDLTFFIIGNIIVTCVRSGKEAGVVDW
jgi:hypothetical protein